MKKETYDITGMSCAACSARIEKGISGMEGMQQCSVNLLKNSMTVSYDEAELDSGKIIHQVEDIGYGASLPLLLLILLGGVLYTAGAIVYAKKGFRYHHLVWHLFIDLALLSHLAGIVFFIG